MDIGNSKNYLGIRMSVKIRPTDWNTDASYCVPNIPKRIRSLLILPTTWTSNLSGSALSRYRLFLCCIIFMLYYFQMSRVTSLMYQLQHDHCWWPSVLLFSKLKQYILWILWSRKYIFLIIKINNFRGDLTDISAKKESLVTISAFVLANVLGTLPWEL